MLDSQKIMNNHNKITEKEKIGLEKIIKNKRLAWLFIFLILVGFLICQIPNIEFLGVVLMVSSIILQLYFGWSYMFSRCPRCHHRFHAISAQEGEILLWYT